MSDKDGSSDLFALQDLAAGHRGGAARPGAGGRLYRLAPVSLPSPSEMPPPSAPGWPRQVQRHPDRCPDCASPASPPPQAEPAPCASNGWPALAEPALAEPELAKPELAKPELAKPELAKPSPAPPETFHTPVLTRPVATIDGLVVLASMKGCIPTCLPFRRALPLTAWMGRVG